MLLHSILTLAYLFLFSALVWKMRFYALPGIDRRWAIAAFWLKILAGFILWAVYTWHYTYRDTSDSYRFYDDAMIIRSLLHENPKLFFSFMTGIGLNMKEAQPVFDMMHGWTAMYSYGLTHDSPTIIRINVLISFFSFGYYHVHTVFMCFLSFTGLTLLYKALYAWFLQKEKLLFIACFLLPSVLFWSSGVLKEAPLIFALGAMIYQGLNLYRDGWKWRRVLFLLLSVYLLLYLKIYVIISLIPAVIFLFVVNRFGTSKLILKFLLVHIVAFALAQNAGYFFSGGDFLHILSRKQLDFYNVARDFNARSTIEIPEITGTISYITHYPQALFLSLFRPHIFEIRNGFYAIFALENLVYVLLLLMALIRFKLPERVSWPIVLAMLSFVLVLGGIVGSTVPVLGAVVRYRIVLLPFYCLILFAIMKPMVFSSIKNVWRRGG